MDNKVNDKPKNSPAKIKANAKYDKLHYKVTNCKMKISEYEQIKAYADTKGLSISKLLLLSVREYIENHN